MVYLQAAFFVLQAPMSYVSDVVVLGCLGACGFVRFVRMGPTGILRHIYAGVGQRLAIDQRQIEHRPGLNQSSMVAVANRLRAGEQHSVVEFGGQDAASVDGCCRDP